VIMTTATDGQQLVGRRTIGATPAAIFALRSDPRRHHETTPADWVRDAISTEPITSVGQVFAMNMFNVGAGGDYVMHNRVAILDQDRTIAWDPGQPDEQGNERVGGWRWRYDLEPNGSGTDVTLTYDWSATPQSLKDVINFPPFPPDFLDQSLAALDRAVTGQAAS